MMTQAAGHSHGGGARAGDRGRLVLALALTLGYTAAEAVGGWLTGSLALLADAGHMLSDSLSLGLALFASWLAARPPTPHKTYGYRRAEVLAALVNGVTLVGVAVWVFFEAYERLADPPAVLGGWMLAVALGGLVVNLAAAWVLHGGHGENLNLSAAYRHVLADLLGSVGALAAALVILLTGWRLADPLISVLIGALILGSSWAVLRQSVNILLEATPEGVSSEEVHRRLAAQEGVAGVTDLHIWVVSSGFPALTAHVLVAPGHDPAECRARLERLLHDELGIDHTTLQMDVAPADGAAAGGPGPCAFREAPTGHG